MFFVRVGRVCVVIAAFWAQKDPFGGGGKGSHVCVFSCRSDQVRPLPHRDNFSRLFHRECLERVWARCCTHGPGFVSWLQLQTSGGSLWHLHSPAYGRWWACSSGPLLTCPACSVSVCPRTGASGWCRRGCRRCGEPGAEAHALWRSRTKPDGRHSAAC